MATRVLSLPALMVAGVTGRGDETEKAWDAFKELTRLNPLTNKASENGYEIRTYSEKGPGEVHVGFAVTSAEVPARYEMFLVPSSMYAEFEIHPASGYESSNAEINQWLADNASRYSQLLLEGKHWVLEVYDVRYKGDNDPESVVGILIPIVPVG